MAKKVQFGIKDVCVWPVTEGTDSTTQEPTISFGTKIAIPGTTKLTLDSDASDASYFYADDMAYYIIPGKNNGRSGTIENALIPEEVMTALMDYIADENGNLVELVNSQTTYFAMAFSKETNDGDIRFVYYKCAFGKLPVSGDTTTDQATPETTAVGIKIVPPNKQFTLGGVKQPVLGNRTGASTTTASWNAWFTTPQLPAEAQGEG